jgi:UDP-glucose 4-epimerase
MNILITGGNGYIGARLVKQFISLGNKVTIVTRSIKKNIVESENLKQYVINWNNELEIKKICNGIDIVIHASGMNAEESEKNPIDAFNFNGILTAKLFKAASDSNVKKFIFLSTIHVYKNVLQGEINEKTYPINLHPYAISNLAGEKFILSLSKNSKTKCIILRISNSFGAPIFKDNNCWSLIINNLCLQAVTESKLELFTNAFQSRDFISMSELCKIIDWLIQKEFTESIIINVGSGESKTLIQMAKIIQERCKVLLNLNLPIIHKSINIQISQPILVYKCLELEKAGYKINNNLINEIDNLLIYCKSIYFNK